MDLRSPLLSIDSHLSFPARMVMSRIQLLSIIAVVALLSAGLGVVVTSQMAPKEVTISLDLGGGKSLDLGNMSATLGDARIRANENAAIATLRSISSAQSQINTAKPARMYIPPALPPSIGV